MASETAAVDAGAARVPAAALLSDGCQPARGPHRERTCPEPARACGAAGALAVLAWALMTVGAFVRSTESGLGCPDWPICHGKLVAGAGTR